MTFCNPQASALEAVVTLRDNLRRHMLHRLIMYRFYNLYAVTEKRRFEDSPKKL